MGLIVLAEFVASHYLISGTLERVPPGWHRLSLPLHRVTPTLLKHATRVQAFMDFARTLLLRSFTSQFSAR